MTNFFLLLSVVIACSQVVVEGKWQCADCRVQYKAVGCYKDDTQRPLPLEILNERDRSSKVFDNHMIDWNDWDSYMAGFACRCAAKAKSLGYTVFGLQFYGECWSGPETDSYKKIGKADDKQCVAQEYKECFKFSRHCIGKQWTNFVYEIVPDCDLSIESLGCFADKHKEGARPMPDYIMTDRIDSTRKDIYSNVVLDWRNWDTYLPTLVCRCAKKAKSLNHKTFGIQYYGECWTSNNADYSYDRDGASTNCVDKCYEPCKPYEKYCSGKQFANYVYRMSGPDVACELNTTPLGCYIESSASRALEVELQNDIDPTNPTFRGHVLDITKWNEQFPGFLCRCARAARERGYSVFGVHNNATCWGAADGHTTYNKHGQSEQCYKGKEKCPGNSEHCAGGENSTFVYKVSKPSQRKKSFIPKVKAEGTSLEDIFGQM